jgi:hypothetical protein
MVDFCESYSPFHVCLTIRPSTHLVNATSHLSFVAFYSYLVSLLAMIWACAYYTDFMDGWFISRVIALFMFVWPYVRSNILSTQLVIYLLSHFIHIWYLGWPWSEHAHIVPISRMVDFCESHSPFHVCLTIHPSHFIHIWYLGWPWSEHVHIIPILQMVDLCESYSPFHVCLTITSVRTSCVRN